MLQTSSIRCNRATDNLGRPEKLGFCSKAQEKNILQSNVEDRFPAVLKLEEESRVLRDFHVVEVEVPKQYFTDQKVAPDHTIKLDRVGEDIPIVRRHRSNYRRLTLIGSNGFLLIAEVKLDFFGMQTVCKITPWNLIIDRYCEISVRFNIYKEADTYDGVKQVKKEDKKKKESEEEDENIDVKEKKKKDKKKRESEEEDEDTDAKQKKKRIKRTLIPFICVDRLPVVFFNVLQYRNIIALGFLVIDKSTIKIRSVGDAIRMGDPDRSQNIRRKIDIENLDGNIMEFTMWDDMAENFDRNDEVEGISKKYNATSTKEPIVEVFEAAVKSSSKGVVGEEVAAGDCRTGGWLKEGRK
ncbi:transcription-associated protein 1-like protein [Tanacetum coccineum]